MYDKRSNRLRFPTRTIAVLATLVCIPIGNILAQSPKPDAANDAPQQESLKVRYARAHLALAKLDLERALQVDRRLPNLLPATAIESLKRHVVIDEEQLKQAIAFPDGDFHEIHVRSAENAVEIAEADLKRKLQAYEDMPGLVTEQNAERAKAVLKVAKLHLEITQEKEASLSSIMYLQWQIELLRNQLLELQLQVGMGR